MAGIQTIREEVKAGELPERLWKKAKAKPDQMVTVTINPGRDELLKQLY